MQRSPFEREPTVGLTLRVPVKLKKAIDDARSYRSLQAWCVAALEAAASAPTAKKARK